MTDVIGGIFAMSLFIVVATLIVTLFGWLLVEAVRTAGRDWSDWRQRRDQTIR